MASVLKKEREEGTKEETDMMNVQGWNAGVLEIPRNKERGGEGTLSQNIQKASILLTSRFHTVKEYISIVLR